jgi:hypothetical protein
VGGDDDQQDLILINKGLTNQIKALQEQVQQEKKIRKTQIDVMRKEVQDTKQKYELSTRDINSKDNELDKERRKVV